MPNPLIVDRLRAGESLNSIVGPLGIVANRHREFPQLVGLHYDMINSPMADVLVQQCRGLILDESDNWRVIAWGFSKFFNEGEQLAAKIDWASASVQEKLDGSLMLVFYYANAWRVATIGMPDAGGEVNGFGMSFADLFWSVVEQYELRAVLNDNATPLLTYMFELTTPENKQVVIHRERKLTLLGGRDASSGQEYHPAVVQRWLFGAGNELAAPTAKTFPLTSIGGIVKSFDTFKPLDQEGYVVCDAKFNRVKVKHPGYVALHHMKSSSSPRALVEIARSGEVDEVVAAFPEWADVLGKCRERVGALARELDADYAKAAYCIPDRKAFAALAMRSRLPAALFSTLDHRVPMPGAYLRSMNIDNLITLLDADGALFKT